MIRLHDFDGPEEFLEAMRSADIVRKHKNLIYVQALKFLQTSGGRGGLRQGLMQAGDAGRSTGRSVKEGGGRASTPGMRCLLPTTRSRRSTWSARYVS